MWGLLATAVSEKETEAQVDFQSVYAQRLDRRSIHAEEDGMAAHGAEQVPPHTRETEVVQTQSTASAAAETFDCSMHSTTCESSTPMADDQKGEGGQVLVAIRALVLKEEAKAARILSSLHQYDAEDPIHIGVKRLYYVATRALSTRQTAFDRRWTEMWSRWWDRSHALIPGDTRTPAERFYAYAAGRLLETIPETSEIVRFESRFHDEFTTAVEAKRRTKNVGL